MSATKAAASVRGSWSTWLNYAVNRKPISPVAGCIIQHI